MWLPPLKGWIHDAIEQDAQRRRERGNIAEIDARIASLTPREREIMKMIVDGKPSKVIAVELNISEKTVHTHRAKIMQKMSAESVAALVRMYLIVEHEWHKTPSG
jgi:FixJ family two-component response regulator